MNLQNLPHENGMLSMIKVTQTMVKENDTTIKFQTKVIKSNLCDYSDAYILLTGDIADTRVDEDTRDAFKNGTPFTKRITHINDERS